MADAIITAADIGDQIRSTATFKDIDEAITDPTDPTIIIRTPAGVETVYVHPTDPEVVKGSTGVYHFDLTFTAHGSWHRRWKGTGAVTTAKEVFTNVRRSAFDAP